MIAPKQVWGDSLVFRVHSLRLTWQLSEAAIEPSHPKGGLGASMESSGGRSVIRGSRGGVGEGRGEGGGRGGRGGGCHPPIGSLRGPGVCNIWPAFTGPRQPREDGGPHRAVRQMEPATGPLSLDSPSQWTHFTLFPWWLSLFTSGGPTRVHLFFWLGTGQVNRGR